MLRVNRFIYIIQLGRGSYSAIEPGLFIKMKMSREKSIRSRKEQVDLDYL
jgi:hypothetical protein